MSVIHAPRKPQLDGRVLVFPILLAPLLLGLFFRLWYLQVVLGSSLVERAESSREKRVQRLAARGLLYDRYGKLVAGIKPELVVTAIPRVVRKDLTILDRVGAILGVPREKLLDKLEGAEGRGYLAFPIYVGASIEAGTRIAEAGDSLPGIAIETKPLRWYPDTVSFTHVLGYTRIPNDDAIARLHKEGIEPAEYIGAVGVERAYEKELMGRPGAEVLEIDAKGRPLRVSGREAAIPGERLEISIDADLQKYAYATLGQAGMKGACVAIEPATGEILAMVSAPSYDQKLFSGGISRRDYDALQENPGKPLLNRATQSAMAPGSTFKIVTAIAAMESGHSISSFGAFCDGEYKIGRSKIKCLGHHGAIGFTHAMEKSCNVYFCSLGRAAGDVALRKAALECGLGNKTDVEIPFERRGVIPTQKWLDVYHQPWYPGHTALMAIGQGYVTATPLQMANLAALVGNDGVAYRPHLLHGVRGPNGLMPTKPEVAHRVVASNEFWSTLKGGLQAVIDSGTGKTAKIPGVAWAGKTGSAEHGNKTGKTHAWFVGFAPAENPKIAICVFAEGAGHGGDFAAPLAGRIVSHYLLTEARRSKASARSKAAVASASRPASR